MNFWAFEWNPDIEDEIDLLDAIAELLAMLDELGIDKISQATIINWGTQ